ncbi:MULTISPECIES: hypothetical protein [Bradyrhizobium]|uniref:Transcriptional regulator n=2 Tax=Bradyrhizobium septentrionale TaxID=1404411 RepID=A0ABZ2NPB8_9BRAD
MDVTHEGEAISVRFVPNTDLTVGSHRRASQSIRLVRTQLKRFADAVETKDGGVTAHFLMADMNAVSDFISRIDEKLDRLRNEKITIKMLEEILLLTPLERQRWTKDGRLPAAGNSYIDRGQKIRLWTYSPDVVARLWKNPEIIENWRKADLASGSASAGQSD